MTNVFINENTDLNLLIFRSQGDIKLSVTLKSNFQPQMFKIIYFVPLVHLQHSLMLQNRHYIQKKKMTVLW